MEVFLLHKKIENVRLKIEWRQIEKQKTMIKFIWNSKWNKHGTFAWKPWPIYSVSIWSEYSCELNVRTDIKKNEKREKNVTVEDKTKIR